MLKDNMLSVAAMQDLGLAVHLDARGGSMTRQDNGEVVAMIHRHGYTYYVGLKVDVADDYQLEKKVAHMPHIPQPPDKAPCPKSSTSLSDPMHELGLQFRDAARESITKDRATCVVLHCSYCKKNYHLAERAGSYIRDSETWRQRGPNVGTITAKLSCGKGGQAGADTHNRTPHAITATRPPTAWTNVGQDSILT